jgi:formate hydrogenlyase subunit 4
MLGVFMTLLAAFFFPGIILRTKAFLSGRKGAGILQPWKDMWRLCRKGSVYSTTTSIIFQISPTIYLATVFCALLIMPFDGQANLLSYIYNTVDWIGASLGNLNKAELQGFGNWLADSWANLSFENKFQFKGDFVFFAYILALGRFFMIISAMDTGSPFEGMGANREALYGLLVEPSYFIWAGSLAMLTGYTSFQDIYAHLNFGNYFSIVLGILATYLLVQIALIENSRMPVDDPTTHLELTMVHEVMILDNSGIDLAMIQLSVALKFVIYGTLIANFFMLPDQPVIFNMLIFLAVQGGFAVTIGIIESFRARNPLPKNPQFIIALSSIATIIFFTVLIITQKYIS